MFDRVTNGVDFLVHSDYLDDNFMFSFSWVFLQDSEPRFHIILSDFYSFSSIVIFPQNFLLITPFIFDGYYVAYKPITLSSILFMFVEMKFIHCHSCVMFAMKSMSMCND